MKKIDIVVTYFNEDLTWIDDLDKTYINHIYIYNKSGSDEYIPVDNIGMDSQTILNHIVKYYDNLPDALLFLQGNPFETGLKPYDTEDINKLITELQYSDHTSNYSISELDASLNNGKISYWKRPLKSTGYDIKTWMKKYFNINEDIKVGPVYWGCQFGVHKEVLKKVPLSLYKELLSQHDSKFGEISHFMERVWGMMLEIKVKNKININYLYGPKVEILGDDDKTYFVEFKDKIGNLYYSDTIKNNMWTQCNIEYYVDWHIYINGKLYDRLNIEGKKVLIHFDSSSLGDSIAWIPYVDEFRKKHNCDIYCATFKNFLYEENYPEINFVNIGEDRKKYYATYSLGWFFNDKKNPKDVRLIPLQQTASDILGLNYNEIRTKLDFKPIMKKNSLGKYVTLSIQSTSQCKYWNRIGGWDKVIRYLNNLGYKVICIDQYQSFGTKETMNYMPKDAINFTNKSLNEISELLYHSEFHMGISSGISWLAWGLGKKVLMVSSFSEPFCEFIEDNYRVYKETLESGYFNTTKYRFDPSNWNWNPFKEMRTLKDWDEFENIEVEDVIKKINELV